MNRNVTILIIVLIILLLAGYLLWLRGKFQNKTTEAITPTPTVIKVETATPTTSQVIASPSAAATSSAKTATSAGSKVK